jgi:hypothetical protein
MDAVPVSMTSWNVTYEGKFDGYRFGLLANPIPSYAALLHHFSQDGAGLSSLKIDAGDLALANISCSLPSTVIRFRIDRLELEMSLWYASAAGFETVESFVKKAASALRQADPGAVFASHAFTVPGYGSAKTGSYDELIRRLVMTTDLFPGENVRAGAVYQFGPDETTGRRLGRLTIEGFGSNPEWLMILGSGTFTAGAVPLEHAVQRFKAFLDETLGRVGIEIQYTGES